MLNPPSFFLLFIAKDYNLFYIPLYNDKNIIYT